MIDGNTWTYGVYIAAYQSSWWVTICGLWGAWNLMKQKGPCCPGFPFASRIDIYIYVYVYIYIYIYIQYIYYYILQYDDIYVSPFPWKMMISHQISMHPILRQTHVENGGMNGMYSNKNHGTVPRTKDIGHQGIQSVYFPSGEYSTAGIKHNRTEQVHCQYLTHCQVSPRK